MTFLLSLIGGLFCETICKGPFYIPIHASDYARTSTNLIATVGSGRTLPQGSTGCKAFTLVVFGDQRNFKDTKRQRAVVMGLGMITPCGNSAEAAWKAILGGRSAVREISLFDGS